MADLLELTADIVCAHASVTEISPNDLLNEIKAIHATLQALEKGKTPAITVSAPETRKRGRKAQAPADLPAAEKVEEKPAAPPTPAMSILEAFKPDEVACMICGKTGMKTLKRHLSTAHDLKPGKYRKQFNIPKDQPLAATNYVAKRRQAALDRGLGEKMAAARAARRAKKNPATIMHS